MTENWRRLGGGAVHFGKSNSLLSKTQPRKTTISRNSFPVSDLSSGGSDQDGQLARIRRHKRTVPPSSAEAHPPAPTRYNGPPQAHSAAQFARSPPARPREHPHQGRTRTTPRSAVHRPSPYLIVAAFPTIFFVAAFPTAAFLTIGFSFAANRFAAATFFAVHCFFKSATTLRVKDPL